MYDININTNYNRQAEINAGDKKRAMLEVARVLGKQLKELEADRPYVAEKTPV